MVTWNKLLQDDVKLSGDCSSRLHVCRRQRPFLFDLVQQLLQRVQMVLRRFRQVEKSDFDLLEKLFGVICKYTRNQHTVNKSDVTQALQYTFKSVYT